MLELFQQGQVFERVLALRRAREGFPVGLYRLVQFACAGQRIAAVIPAVGVISPGKILVRSRIVLTLIGRSSRPGRVLEQFNRGLIVTLLQGALPLLVRGQPQVIPDPGPGRLGLGDQQQRQQADDPATPEQCQRQRQQQYYQQVALVLPGVGRAVQRQGRLLAGQGRFRQQGGEIRVIDLHGHVNTAGGGCQCAQWCLLQGRHYYGPLPVLEEAAPGQRYRCPGCRAHPHDCQACAAAGHDLLYFPTVFCADAVGNQQNFAVANARGMQQLNRRFHRRPGITTRHRHHVGAQCRQQIGDSGRIVRQGGDDMGVTRVGDQPGLALLAQGEQVQQFLPGPIQARRRQIPRLHRVAQVQHEHQCVLLLVHRLWNFLPAGAAGRQSCQEPAHQDEGHQVWPANLPPGAYQEG